jgi:pimeloyl-ACP methyl ester carboxylesterase
MRRVVTGIAAAAVIGLVASGAPLASAATSPTPKLSLVTAGRVTTGSPCNPRRVTTCALPYPNNRWTRVDPTSATGLRVNVPDSLIPADVLSQFPATMKPLEDLDSADGFSAAGPIVFEIDRPAAPASLPVDGGNVIAVFDADTGARIPVRTRFDTEGEKRGASNTTIFVWPRSRFPWGHHLVAALTTSLKPASSAAFVPSRGMQALSSQPRRWVWTFLAGHGIARSNVLSVTDFTTRSEANATDPLVSMIATTNQQAHPIRNVATVPNFLGLADIDTIVTGQVQLTDFRDKFGEIHYQPGDHGRPGWVDFVMTEPTVTPKSGAPVVVYGHGIGIFKETLIIVAPTNAAHGVATIAIDQPNHGARSGPEGGQVFDLTTPKGLGRLFGMVVQSSVDQASVLRAVQTSLANLDAGPWKLFQTTLGDGQRDLDPSRLFYEGTSLGGVLGAATVALSPELGGAALQVSGVGVLHDVTETFFWEHGFNESGVGFRAVIPASATAGEDAFLISAAQQLVGVGDAVNFVDRIPVHRTPVLVPYALDDGTVDNQSTEALAELAQLPVLGKVLRPVPFLPKSTTVPDSGIVQIDTSTISDWSGPLFGPLRQVFSHIIGVGDQSELEIGQWLGHRLTALGSQP